MLTKGMMSVRSNFGVFLFSMYLCVAFASSTFNTHLRNLHWQPARHALGKELHSRSTICALGCSDIEGTAALLCYGGHLIIRMDEQWCNHKCLAYLDNLACLLVVGI